MLDRKKNWNLFQMNCKIKSREEFSFHIWHFPLSCTFAKKNNTMLNSTGHVVHNLHSTVTSFYFSVTEKFLENIHTMLNEPSVGLYRVQEHVRRSLPQLVDKKVHVYVSMFICSVATSSYLQCLSEVYQTTSNLVHHPCVWVEPVMLMSSCPSLIQKEL